MGIGHFFSHYFALNSVHTSTTSRSVVGVEERGQEWRTDSGKLEKEEQDEMGIN